MCGATDDEPVCCKRRGERSYTCVRCRRCAFHFVNPEPDEGELLALYDAAYEEGHRATWHGLEDELNSAVVELLRAHGVTSVVDLGAGQGRFVQMARGAGLAAEGVEPSAANCRAAAVRYGLALQRATIRAFLETAPPGDLAAVTLLNVLEHLPDPQGVLRDLFATVRPGGLVVVVVPNVRFTLLLGWVRRRLGFRDVFMLESARFTQQGFDPPIHLSSFDAVHLRRALESAGFDVPTMRQAPVIGTARAAVTLAKRTVQNVGRALELMTGGRVVWGYSLLAVARKPTPTTAAHPAPALAAVDPGGAAA